MLENFNRLMDIVMTFTLGLREYNGKNYVTLENRINDLVFYTEHIKLRNKTILELLLLEPVQAYRLVNYLKNIMSELERDFFKVRDYNSENTLEQFELVCTLRGVVVAKPGHEQGQIISSNFTNQLENDIAARIFTIEHIEEGLKSAIEGVLPKPVSIFVDDGVIDNLPDMNTDNKDEVKWSLWFKITDEGKLRIGDWTTSPAPVNVPNNEFLRFLNEQGQTVFSDITEYYKGARPIDLFAVYYAMVDLNLVLEDRRNLYKLTRRVVAEMFEEAFGTTLSTQIVGYNISAYERKSFSQEEKIKEAKKIISGFLKKIEQ